MNPGSIIDAIGGKVHRLSGRIHSHIQEDRPLPADVLESDYRYRIVFDAPGARLEDVHVSYFNGSVNVRIERLRPDREGFEVRFPGRATTLEGETVFPEGTAVKPEAATATLTDDGTITVDVPKGKERAAEADEIPVE